MQKVSVLSDVEINLVLVSPIYICIFRWGQIALYLLHFPTFQV
jgi:hypothetical protein